MGITNKNLVKLVVVIEGYAEEFNSDEEMKQYVLDKNLDPYTHYSYIKLYYEDYTFKLERRMLLSEIINF